MVGRVPSTLLLEELFSAAPHGTLVTYRLEYFLGEDGECTSCPTTVLPQTGSSRH